MLRYYDNCGLLHPADIDKFTSYRLYSGEQISVLSKIVTLRDMGFSIDDIKRILPNFNDSEFLKQEWIQKNKEINRLIDEQKLKLQKITELSAMLDKENINMVYEVEVKELKEEKVISLRKIISSYADEGALWEELYKLTIENNIDCSNGEYSIYYDDEYKEDNVDVEIAVVVSTLGDSSKDFVFRKLEAIPQAATIRFSGAYEGYSLAMSKLAKWVQEEGYVFDGLIRGLAIVAPSSNNIPEDYMTEIQVPIRKVQ